MHFPSLGALKRVIVHSLLPLSPSHLYTSSPRRKSKGARNQGCHTLLGSPFSTSFQALIYRGRLAFQLSNLFEYGDDVFTELGGILAHREVAYLFHDGHLHTGDGARGAQGVLGLAGKIVFAGEQIKRAGCGVDPIQLSPQVGVHPVEIEVPPKYAGTALHVLPEGLMAVLVGALRGDQAGYQGSTDFAPMHIAPMKPACVIPGLLEVGGFEADQGSKFSTISMSELEDDPASDGTSQGNGALQAQGGAESPDGCHI